jgi:tRNA(Ile)-lysidine synthase
MTVDAALAAFTLRFPVRQRKLVAVSGGRDSTALLHALHAAGHRKLVVCHLNHRLRGRASTGDASFVRRLAEKLGLPCEVAAVNVKQEAKRAGESLESAGRRIRHRFLAECARRHRCRLVLMAHHADDQAETVLFNLLRGAGGLRGMEPERELRVPGHRVPLRVVRPMLAVTRGEIDAWITAHGLTFREDATNAEPGATRNKLRHQVLPYLSELLGRDVRPALCRAAEISHEEQEWLDAAATLFAADECLEARTLAGEPPALLRRIILLWLRRHALRGIGFDEVEAVRAMLDLRGGPARVNLPDNRFVRRSGGLLRVEPVRRRRHSREFP